MKRIVLALAFLGLWLPTAAQGNVLSKIGAWSKTTLRLPEIQTASQVMAQRAETSIRQAQQAYQALPVDFPLNMYYAPVVNVSNASAYYETNLYSNLHFLNTTQKFKNYIIARNNRLFANEVRRLNTLAPELEMHYPALKRRAKLLEQVPRYKGLTQEQWMHELIQLIPEQTRYLFLGEQHGFAAIQQALQDFVSQLRHTYPQRKIILFSEFLPKGVSFSSPHDMQATWFDMNKHVESFYVKLFEKALSENITVVGLEHPDRYVFYPYAETINAQSPGQVPFWNSLEGVSQRNELWYQILQTYRAKNPDALFVIHTGAGHALYNRPFSLGARFAKEETFIAAFYPQSTMSTYYKDPIELLYKPAELPETFLYFTIPAHIQAAGFDARLRIPVFK